MSENISRLCDRCQEFDIRALLLTAEAAPSQGHLHDAVTQFFTHRPNLVTLKKSASHCDLCSAIWEQFARDRKPADLSDHVLEKGIGNRPIYLETLAWDTGLNTVPHVVAMQYGPPNLWNPHLSMSGRQIACFEACAEHGVQHLDHQQLLGRLQAKSSADDGCLQLARSWLETCRRDHPECNQTLGITLKFPTRVLDVTPGNLMAGTASPETELVRLVPGDGRAEPYVTLSYVWGGPQDLLLTSETKEKLSAGLRTDVFPGTWCP